MKVHLGHPFYGAGNIGDDLALAGFLYALEACGLGERLRLSCCIPFDLSPLQARFPQIEWLEADLETRRAAIAESDVWLGVGGSPFQSDDGLWLLGYLAEEAALCRELGVPMAWVGVGVNNEGALQELQARRLLEQATGIWVRDPRSLRLLRAHSPHPERVHEGADLAHVFLRACTVRREPDGEMLPPDRLGLCLHSHAPLQEMLAPLERLLRAVDPERCSWLVQEVRILERGEQALHALLPPDLRAALPPYKPDYAGAATPEALLASWPRCERLLSARYHAALVHAWAGAALGVLAINDKLRGVAEELGVPVQESLQAWADLAPDLPLEQVPRERLEVRARLAEASVAAWWEEAVAPQACQTEASAAVQASPGRRPMHAETSTETELSTWVPQSAASSQAPQPGQVLWRLAVLCPDSLGDLVLRQSMLTALQDQGYQVVVVARPALLHLLPALDQRLESLPLAMDPYRLEGAEAELVAAAALRQLASTLRGHAITHLVCPAYNRTWVEEGLLRMMPEVERVGLAPGCPAVVGCAGLFALLQVSPEAPLWTRAVAVEEGSHETIKHRVLLWELAGLRLADDRPRLRVPDGGNRAAHALLRELGWEPWRYAVACPQGTANVAIKAVPTAITVEVVRMLSCQEGLPVLLVGVEAERAALLALEAACADEGATVRVWIGAPHEITVLLGLLARARIFVGGDSGPMHMAAALGVPVAAVFGGGTYPRFLPTALHTWVAARRLDCYGCAWDCPYEVPRCLHDLDPAWVAHGVRLLLRETSSQGGPLRAVSVEQQGLASLVLQPCDLHKEPLPMNPSLAVATSSVPQSQPVMLVTGANARHFPLLCMLLASWKVHNPDLPVLVCDYGFNEAQVALLRRIPNLEVAARPTLAVEHPWMGKARLGRYLSQTSKPWDIVVWIDADALFLHPYPDLGAHLQGYDMLIDPHIEAVGDIVHLDNQRTLGLDPSDAYFSSGCWIARRRVLLDDYERFTEQVQGVGNLWENDAFVAAIYHQRLRVRTIHGGVWHARGKTSLHTCRVEGLSATYRGQPVYVLHANDGYSERADGRRIFVRPELARIQDHYERLFWNHIAPQECAPALRPIEVPEG